MKIIVIGAGISGLSVAYFLTKKGHDVHVIERESEVGGLAGSFNVNGYFLEKYYHHSFAGHSDLHDLMRELNIDKQYVSHHTKTGFYFNNQIFPFVSATDLLHFKPLKFINRIRLGLTSLIMMCIKDWNSLEKNTALDWLRRYSGEEVCEIIWQPLLKMKFGDDYKQISAAWLWNRVVDRKKTGAGREVLGYINGGYKTLFDSLLEKIEIQGGKITTNSPVEEICLNKGKISGVRVNGRFINGDGIVSTVSIASFLKMTSFLPETYINALESIKYQGSICVILKLKKALSSYYWINVSDPDSPFVGIIEQTNFISSKNYGNNHFVYLTKYSSSNSEIFLQPNETIYNDFISFLAIIFGDFNKDDVSDYWVFKNRFSQPVFIKNYNRIMPQYKTPIKNLYLLNTSQIYPESRSLNSSIRQSRQFSFHIN